MVALLYGSLTKKETKIFTTNKSFYKMTGYLQKNEFIKCREINALGEKEFSLTTRGEMLALLLESLSDFDKTMIKEKIRRKSIWL
jgi:hypothetical protein